MDIYNHAYIYSVYTYNIIIIQIYKRTTLLL